jgi:hypothetical protein
MSDSTCVAIAKAQIPCSILRLGRRSTERTLERQVPKDASGSRIMIKYITADPNQAYEVLEITPNLLAFLRRVLSLNLEYQYLWVDAICINQQDLAERSSQVAMMRTVFQKSQFNVLWLGEQVSEDAEADILIREFIDLMRQDTLDRGLLQDLGVNLLKSHSGTSTPVRWIERYARYLLNKFILLHSASALVACLVPVGSSSDVFAFSPDLVRRPFRPLPALYGT